MSEVFGAVAVGIICGAFPLKAGITRNRRGLAGVSFVANIVAGFFGGLVFAIPCAIVSYAVIGLLGESAP